MSEDLKMLDSFKAGVTGAAGGLGRALGGGLVDRRARVIAIDREPCSPDDEHVAWVQADLSTSDGVDVAARNVHQLVQSLDLLVNCAGTFLADGTPAGDLHWSRLDELMHDNV